MILRPRLAYSRGYYVAASPSKSSITLLDFDDIDEYQGGFMMVLRPRDAYRRRKHRVKRRRRSSFYKKIKPEKLFPDEDHDSQSLSSWETTMSTSSASLADALELTVPSNSMMDDTTTTPLRMASI